MSRVNDIREMQKIVHAYIEGRKYGVNASPAVQVNRCADSYTINAQGRIVRINNVPVNEFTEGFLAIGYSIARYNPLTGDILETRMVEDMNMPALMNGVLSFDEVMLDDAVNILIDKATDMTRDITFERPVFVNIYGYPRAGKTRLLDKLRSVAGIKYRLNFGWVESAPILEEGFVQDLDICGIHSLPGEFVDIEVERFFSRSADMNVFIYDPSTQRALYEFPMNLNWDWQNKVQLPVRSERQS